MAATVIGGGIFFGLVAMRHGAPNWLRSPSDHSAARSVVATNASEPSIPRSQVLTSLTHRQAAGAAPVPVHIAEAIAAIESDRTQALSMYARDGFSTAVARTGDATGFLGPQLFFSDRTPPTGADALPPRASDSPALEKRPWPAVRLSDDAVKLQSLHNVSVIEFNPQEHPYEGMRLVFPHDTTGGTISIGFGAASCRIDGQPMQPGHSYDILPGSIFTAPGVVDVLVRPAPPKLAPPAGRG